MRLSRLPSAILSLVVCLSISACGASLQTDDKPQIAVVDAVVTPSDATDISVRPAVLGFYVPSPDGTETHRVEAPVAVYFRASDGESERYVVCANDASIHVNCDIPGVGSIRLTQSAYVPPTAKYSDETPMPASVE